MGDTIYSIGNGKVISIFISDYNNGCSSYIITILHKTKKAYIASQYRHCGTILVEPEQYVSYLQPIATIGNECGLFQAHLHFEIRTNVFKGIENGYGDPEYLDPMKFIKEYNRGEH
jgi:murein DD-endopeptidase MepM/ murein hydrolase activator NlpD